MIQLNRDFFLIFNEVLSQIIHLQTPPMATGEYKNYTLYIRCNYVNSPDQ